MPQPTECGLVFIETACDRACAEAVRHEGSRTTRRPPADLGKTVTGLAGWRYGESPPARSRQCPPGVRPGKKPHQQALVVKACQHHFAGNGIAFQQYMGTAQVGRINAAQL